MTAQEGVQYSIGPFTRTVAEDDEREAVLWEDLDGAEVISYTDPDDAMEMILDGYHGQPTPRTVELLGYAPKVFSYTADGVAVHIAENLDDWLTEDHGNPEEATELPKELHDALDAFAAAVVKHWPVWQCDEVERCTVNCVAWVRANRPGWTGTWQELTDD